MTNIITYYFLSENHNSAYRIYTVLKKMLDEDHSPHEKFSEYFENVKLFLEQNYDSKNEFLLENSNADMLEEKNYYQNLGDEKLDIPFRIEDLNLIEKMRIQDHLLGEYLRQLDPTLMTLAAKISPKSFKPGDEHYIDFLSFNLMKKIFELKNEKDPIIFGLISTLTEGIKLVGLPKVKKISILVYACSRWLDYSETQESYLDPLKQLMINIFARISKELNNKESLIEYLSKKKLSDDSKHSNPKIENAKNLSYLKEYFLANLIIITSSYLTKSNQSEEEKLSLQNEILQQVPIFYNHYILDSFIEDFKLIINFTENFWCNKLLGIIREFLFVLLTFHKEHFKDSADERSSNAKILTKLDSNYLFSDSKDFEMLKIMLEKIKDKLLFTNYEKSKEKITNLIIITLKTQKKVVREILVRDWTKSQKSEPKFMKEYFNIDLNFAKIYYLSNKNQKTVKKLLKMCEVAKYTQNNPFEKMPNILNRALTYEILLNAFYKLNGYIESLLVLQFTSKVENPEIEELINRITIFDPKYIKFIFLPIILEKIFEKFHQNRNLVQELTQRMKSPEVYSSNFEWKTSKLIKQAKIMCITYLYNNLLT